MSRALLSLAISSAFLFGFAAQAGAQALCEVANDGPPIAAIDPEALPELLRRQSETARAIAAAVPATTLDVFAVFGEVAPDPEALRIWVRDSTTLIAYRGVLRGPQGVLADRHGNSLDRSLLLAELVELSGYDVRLANAPLGAADLARKARRLNFVSPLPVADITNLDPEMFAGGFPDADERSSVACREAILARANEQASVLARMIADAGIAGEDDAPRDSLSDHWWVQYFDGENWRDLDVDELAVAPARTLGVRDLPPDFFHIVEFKVVAERIGSTTSTTATVLEYTAAAMDWLGATATLAFRPLTQLPDGNIAVDPATAFAEEQFWLATIRIDGKTTFGNVVATDGGVRAYDPAAIADAAEQLGQNAGGLLGGGLLGGGPGEAEGLETTLGAVTLEITLSAPGAQPRIERRTIYVGPTAGAEFVLDDHAKQVRAAGLLAIHDAIVTPANEGETVNLARMASDLASFLGIAADLLDDPEATVSQNELIEITERVPRVPLPLYFFSALRSLYDYGAYPVAANVILLHQTPGVAGAPETIELDIVANDTVGAVGGPGVFQDRLRVGVLETVLEDALLANASDPPINTSRRFATDLAAGEDWEVLEPGATNAAGLSPAATMALEDGFVVIAPEVRNDPVDLAFWRVDPRTGTTIGIGPSGAGQGLVELIQIWGRFGAFAYCVTQPFYQTAGGHQLTSKEVLADFGCLAFTGLGAFGFALKLDAMIVGGTLATHTQVFFALVDLFSGGLLFLLREI